jgi:hypothetical protein
MALPGAGGSAAVGLVSPPAVELVVARYAEPLDWLDREPFAGHARTVYDKSPRARHGPGVVALPNVGRCDHTYLFHVVRRYDSLADVTVMLPGSATDGHKWPNALQVLDRADRTRASVFPGREVDGLHTFEDFRLDTYRATHPDNLKANPESVLEPAVPRPFGPWFRTHVARDPDGVRLATFQGIFAVSRADVLRRPRSYYDNLLATVSGSSNPEAGHYMERSWAAIFGH